MKVASTNDVLAKVAINKSLLKEYSNSEYSRIVYMRDNSEFQIQLFNPYSYTIGVDITIDNKSLGNRLIVKPGERIWLERYFNEARKFLFSTYEVSGTSREVKEAISKNGEIEIKFYREDEPIKISNIFYQPLYTQKLYCNEYNYGLQGTSAKNYCSLDSNLNLELNASRSINCSTTQCYNDSNTTLTSSVSQPRSKTIETGRVERGGYSNQKFETMNINFEYWAFHTEVIKILPESQKPVFKNDLQKQYCANCGRKLNPKYKFCPYCGFKVDMCPNQNTYVLEKCPNCGRNVRSTMTICPHCNEILR